MVRLLPAHPSLEQLKNQAKDLLAAYRRGEPDARARLQRWFPDQDGAPGGPLSPAPGTPPETGTPPTSAVAARTLRLSNAQLTIAREHGFPSWARLAAWVAREELPDDLATQVELLGVRSWRVVRAATDALTRAGAAGAASAIEGLSHPSPRVRRGAADFMDHHADDSCVAKLADLALHDPVPYVRRTAVHALLCQRCKPAPLTTDVVPWLMHVAREDPSHRVRLSALWGLGQQGRDARVVEMLSTFLRQEDDLSLRSAAHQALRRQSPEYRQETAQRARAASMATPGRRAQVASWRPRHRASHDGKT